MRANSPYWAGTRQKASHCQLKWEEIMSYKELHNVLVMEKEVHGSPSSSLGTVETTLKTPYVSSNVIRLEKPRLNSKNYSYAGDNSIENLSTLYHLFYMVHIYGARDKYPTPLLPYPIHYTNSSKTNRI